MHKVEAPEVIHLDPAAVLLTDLWRSVEALRGVKNPERHPLIRKAQAAIDDLPDPERERRYREARARAARRKRDIEAGLIP